MMRYSYSLLLAALLVAWGSARAATINREELRDRIYGCWIGKNIGGTLGGPYEGKREILDVKGYSSPAGEPLPNDDLDLQLVWLKALHDHGPRAIDAQLLGEYWLDFIPPYWNEYGICKSNMRAGLLPPLSGMYHNQWKHSNGAWIRTEIWACLAPGCPDIAIKYAYSDASVDHGSGEGTIAALFTAAVESAAFVVHDRDELIDIGLAHIPTESRVAKSIRIVMDARAKGLPWQKARELVVQDSKDLGWFQAPANVAFSMIGWLYGGNDFGESLKIATSCGDDTDCTAATLGSILGIIKGRKAIPEEWVKPIGEKILTVAINRGAFRPPSTVEDLTNRVMEQVPLSLAAAGAPVHITDAPTDLGDTTTLKLKDPGVAREIASRSGYAVTFDFLHTRAVLDYGKDPDIKPGIPFKLTLSLYNDFPDQRHYDLKWNLPKGWKVSPGMVSHIALNAGRAEKQFEITAEKVESTTNRGVLEIIAESRPTVGVIPVLFFAGE